MRILYAVFGYGRGHATRAASVLSELADHDVMICAGGDALAALRSHGPVRPIPALRFAYSGGRRSLWRTVTSNVPAAVDLFGRGPIFRALLDDVRAFRPDLAICDAEPWAHHVAARLGVPRIGFDHYGVLAYCRPPCGSASWLARHCDTTVYRLFTGEPDRVLVSSFYHAEPLRPGVRCVGPLLRNEVLATARSTGDHLLVYLNNGEHQFTPAVEAALHGVGLPAIVYGTGRTGASGQLRFSPPSDLGFLADLASCRAVVSTAGNQLVGEAMHFGKPMLVIPEDSVEQHFNAAAVEQLGIGRAARALTAPVIADFLAGEDRHALRARALARDGRAEALTALDEMARELTGRALLPARTAQVAA